MGFLLDSSRYRARDTEEDRYVDWLENLKLWYSKLLLLVVVFLSANWGLVAFEFFEIVPRSFCSESPDSKLHCLTAGRGPFPRLDLVIHRGLLLFIIFLTANRRFRTYSTNS
jgi:hypothetical protein